MYAGPYLLLIIAGLALAVFIAVFRVQQMKSLSSRRLAAIEAAGDGIGIVDADENLVYMNKALMDLHGIQEQDAHKFLGNKWDRLYTKKGRRHIRDVVIPSLRKDGVWRGDSPLLTEDGEIIEAEMSLSLLSDGGFIGTARDVTLRKKAEKEKEAMQKQFVQMQKMEAVGRLTGGIAHDFNNMLTIINGNIEMLHDLIERSPDTDRCIQATRRAIDRGSDLTQRLLAFSRKQVLTPQTVNLNSIIPDTVSMMKRAMGDQIEIVIDLGEELWPTRVDPGQVENAILNLSINARDAMRKDGGQITIRTANVIPSETFLAVNPFVLPGPYVVISVSDTGPGISADIIGRIFDPFFTTKPAGQGTGLGLSMVYGFAKQSGGYIIAENNRDSGATFSLFFPASAKVTAETRNDPAEEKAPAKGAETILVVENEKDILDYNKNLLTKMGYDVHIAKTGAEAVMMLDKLENPGLLMTDIIMPGGVSGKDLAEEARDAFPGIKILFVSGYAEQLISDLLDRDPGMDFMSKPYTGEQLSQKIRRLLDKGAEHSN